MAGEIFISYRRSDQKWARLLHDRLAALGVHAWYDVEVGAGADWRMATADALEAARIFVLLFSSAAAKSDDIAKELAAATLEKKLVVPVRLEDIQPRGAFLYELASRNWVNAFEDTEAKLTELAASLAHVVTSGSADESVIPFDREARGGKFLARLKRPIWVAAASVAVIALLGAGFSVFGVTSVKPTAGRIAFFGIDAPADDRIAVSTASATSSDILATFSALQRDVVASADTEGIAAKDRLDHATKLRATYAISGSVTHAGDDLSVSVRIEDAASRTTVWVDGIAGKASNPGAVANRIAAQLNDLLNCLIAARKSLPHDDMRIVARLPLACRSVRESSANNADRWRELAELAPNSAWVQAGEAMMLYDAIRDASPTTVDELRRRADEALRRAETLGPDIQEVAEARITAAEANHASLKEIEALFLDGLRRAPRGSDINGTYADFLVRVGRSGASIRYGRDALALDPLSYNKMLGVAASLVSARAPAAEADALFTQRHAQFPGPAEWIQHTLAAAFHGVGDAESILSDPPPEASAQLTKCVGDIVRFAREHTTAANAKGAKSAAACADSGAFDAAIAVQVRALFGDYEPILDPNINIMVYSIFIFDPATPGLRSDKRFLAAATKAGLLAYWRDSPDNAPDFCATEKAPVCAAIAAK